jgi:hypothetical protein
VPPDTGTYSVWSTSDLRGTWQRMTNVEASAEGIMRTLTFRDLVPVRDYSSRFYRVLPVP